MSYPAITAAGAAATAISLWDTTEKKPLMRWALASDSTGPWLLSQWTVTSESGAFAVGAIGA